MKLHSQRLLAIAHLIEEHKQGDILADIGTDHAYLPCFLYGEKVISHAYACDVASGPLSSSQETIAREHMEEAVIPLLGNGLDPVCDKPVDMISICGMGGLLISEILDAHQERLEGPLFILQANTAIDLLREYLMTHDMEIIDETLVKDVHHIYEIIVTKRSVNVHYEKKDLLFGPVLRMKKGPLFEEKWKRELKIQKRILTSLKEEHKRYQEVRDMISLIEESLA